MPPLLEARGLEKRFGAEVVLGPVDLLVQPGEVVAVTGPSGSGKTTLLRLLAGLIDPTGGEVLQDGRVVSRPGWQEPPHRRGIGMLFQELALWPHLTVRQQLEFMLPRERGIPSRARRERAEQVLASLRLGALAARLPEALSGGERQRVAWGRAIVSRPRILFLDEPLTSLDPRLRGELLGQLENLGRSPERAILVVTHDPEVAARVATRAIELD